MVKPDMLVVQRNLNYLFTDLSMLMDGDWMPDWDSVSSSLDSIQRIAAQLDIELMDLREERDNGGS